MKTRAAALTVAVLLCAGLLAGCGQDSGPTADASTSPSTATGSGAGSTATTGASSDGSSSDGATSALIATEAAPSLTLMVPGTATTVPQSYSDGHKGVAFPDATSRISLVVDHYEPGASSADDVVSAEKAAFDQEGVSVSTRSVEVAGAGTGTRLDWTQESRAPWGDGSDSSVTDLTCAAVIVEAPNGYTYAVYGAADSGSTEAVAAMEAALSSIEVAP